METRQRTFHTERDRAVYLIAKETATITDAEERIDCIMQYVRMCDSLGEESIKLKAENFILSDRIIELEERGEQ
ncbi:hypothetical protein [Parapedobacter soli]|uniref:hypothetical protein n=1 Tax=Parapedobacter soli TaxID=416955 RepID=UPI0021C60815|nr:hypothetical protein [Parapedobacter soli]